MATHQQVAYEMGLEEGAEKERQRLDAIRRGNTAKRAEQKPAHAPACVECKLDDGDDYAQCTVCGSWFFMSCCGHWQRLHG